MKRRQVAAKRVELYTAELARVIGQIPQCAGHYGRRSGEVTCRVMMEGDGRLRQSLDEEFRLSRGGAPRVFECLVRLEELAAIEEGNAAREALRQVGRRIVQFVLA